MRILPDRLSVVIVACLIGVSVALLGPTALQALRPPAAVLAPLPAVPPPAGVLLKEELDRDLDGVMILVSQSHGRERVGTAFLVDRLKDLVTAADLVQGAEALRLIDASGGSHAARVIGVDPVRQIAVLRADVTGVPLDFGRPGSLVLDDPLDILASSKSGRLPPSTPAVVSGLDPEAVTRHTAPLAIIRLVADLHPEQEGSPVVGVGGTVLGVIVNAGDSELLSGTAVSIVPAATDISAWTRTRMPIPPLLPLAALPSSLVLRGIDAGGSPTGLALSGLQPPRGPASQSISVTLRGTGFLAGPALRVRFIPLASPTGAFDGGNPTVVDSSTVTVSVPAGQPVRDYSVELTNGDGSIAGSRPVFTIVP